MLVGRAAATALAALVLLACSDSASGSPRPSAGSAVPTLAATQAADLRTRLDLLFAEQVMIVAKESAAAVNHSDEYGAYTALLTANSADLEGVMSRAFGNTTAAELRQEWDVQNGHLVAYAIGVVTHDDAKAKAAAAAMTGQFVPRYGQLLSDASHLPLDPVTQLLTQQLLEDKAFIDDYFTQKYPAFYADLHRAYAQSSRLGDALAVQITLTFPDKFPGDASRSDVDARVTLNLVLQEHSYLATMATSATVAGRAAEKSAAAFALAANADSLGTRFGAAPRFKEIWTSRDNSLLGYAIGDADVKKALTVDFVENFSSLAHVAKVPVAGQLDATLKAIDDQRLKVSSAVAGDDRAAATAMQPLADSIR